jgi:hypothetical protein
MASAAGTAGASVADDLHRIFGARLRSVVAYGPQLDGAPDAPLTCLALVTTLTLPDLEACAALVHGWSRARIATPLILPEEEFDRSLDAFPLEYGEIIRAHAVLFGDNPFAAVTIDPEDLRRACEAQVKGHLVHLRQGFMDTGRRPRDLAALVTASAAAFSSLLRNVARLHGVNLSDRMEMTTEGARRAGVPAGLVSDLLALEHGTSIPTTDPARLFPQYLAAVEQLARTIDSWSAA